MVLKEIEIVGARVRPTTADASIITRTYGHARLEFCHLHVLMCDTEREREREKERERERGNRFQTEKNTEYQTKTLLSRKEEPSQTE